MPNVQSRPARDRKATTAYGAAVSDVKEHFECCVTQAAQEWLRGEHATKAAAKRAHGIGNVNPGTFNNRVEKWRPFIKPTPTAGPAEAPAAAAAAGHAGPLPSIAWSSIKDKDAYAAKLAESFKGLDKVAARSLAGMMFAGAAPGHQTATGGNIHSKRQIQAAVVAAKIPGIEKFGANTVKRAKDDYLDDTKPRRGAQPKLPRWFDDELLLYIRCRREIFKVPVTKQGLLNHINRLIKGSTEAQKFKGGKVQMSWLKSFLKRNKEHVGTGVNRNLEASREAWTTPENVSQHYIVLAEQLVACGAAVWNEAFDGTRGSEMIFITHPDLILSFDETGFNLGQAGDGAHGIHTKTDTGKMKKSGGKLRAMNRYTVAAHSSTHVTGVGGSLANGDAMRPGFINAGKTYDERWTCNDRFTFETCVPCSNIVDEATGNKLTPSIIGNGKGGMDNSLSLWVLLELLLPTFERSPSINQDFKVKAEPAWRYEEGPFKRSATADQTLHGQGPVGSTRQRYPTAITDGHGSHLTLELLEAVNDLSTTAYTGPIKRIGLVLRPPHTTHKLQSEDVVSFKLIKGHWRLVKDEKIDTNARGVDVINNDTWPAHRTGPKYKKMGLDMFDFFPMVKQVWEQDFMPDNNLRAWKEIGVRPYNMGVYWDLVDAREEADKLMSELVATMSPLDRDEVRLLNAKAVLPDADVSDDDLDLDGADGYDAAAVETAADLNAKRLENARALVVFLENHATGVNQSFQAGYDKAVDTLVKWKTPKVNHRVPTSAKLWHLGNLGNEAVIEMARAAHTDKLLAQRKLLANERERDAKAVETRRHHLAEAPRFIRALHAAKAKLPAGADLTAADIEATCTDEGTKAVLHHMGQLAFAAGNKGKRCEQLAAVLAKADLTPLDSLPPPAANEKVVKAKVGKAASGGEAAPAKAKAAAATPPAPPVAAGSGHPSTPTLVPDKPSSPLPGGGKRPASSPRRSPAKSAAVTQAVANADAPDKPAASRGKTYVPRLSRRKAAAAQARAGREGADEL